MLIHLNISDKKEILKVVYTIIIVFAPNLEKIQIYLIVPQCSYCEKKLKTGQNLAEHERQHTGEKPFPCKVAR